MYEPEPLKIYICLNLDLGVEMLSKQGEFNLVDFKVRREMVKLTFRPTQLLQKSNNEPQETL